MVKPTGSSRISLPCSRPGLDVVVFSRTLAPTARRGGTLFRSLLDAGLVDTVEVAVMPVLLGSGIPLLPPGRPSRLVLADQKTLPASGIVVLSYSVAGATGAAPRIGYVSATTPENRP